MVLVIVMFVVITFGLWSPTVVADELATPAPDGELTSLSESSSVVAPADSDLVTITSFDCATGIVSFSTTGPVPNGIDVELKIGGEVRGADFVWANSAGQFTSNLATYFPKEGLSVLATVTVRALSDEGPIDSDVAQCNTPDLPVVTITSVNCETGEVTIEATGAISVDAQFYAYVLGNPAYNYEELFPIEQAGTLTVQIPWDNVGVQAVDIMLLFRSYVADTAYCEGSTEPPPPPYNIEFGNAQFIGLSCSGGTVSFDIIASDFPPEYAVFIQVYGYAYTELSGGTIELIPRNGGFIREIAGYAIEGEVITLSFELDDFLSNSEGGFDGFSGEYDGIRFLATAYTAAWNVASAPLEQFVSCDDAVDATPEVSLSTDRATVGTTLGYELTGFPPSTTVDITWRRLSGSIIVIDSIATDANGAFSGSFPVPATPGGPGQQIRFSYTDGDDTVTLTAPFNVAPRITVSGTPAAPGDAVSLNVRGLARQDTLRVRWFDPNAGTNGQWIQVGSVTTTNTGSVTDFQVVVPDFAVDGLNRVRVDGAINAQTNSVAITRPPDAAATVNPERATVGSTVAYSLTDFPADATGQISWRRLTGSVIAIGTFTTDGQGAATGSVTVPASPGGPGQQIIFATDDISVSVPFNIAPRIQVTPSPATNGQTVDVSLRGLARQDAVRIRWFDPSLGATGAWVEVATVTTSNTGSANITIPVPEWAPVGANKVRADGTLNAQTNALQIEAPLPD